MRYKLDNDGYISSVYFNCHTGSCNAYTGAIPDGYYTLEDWAENANIRAYRIVNGNLVFDSEEDARLQSLWENQSQIKEGTSSKILWTNPNIGSAFSAQTISMPELSNYDCYC